MIELQRKLIGDRIRNDAFYAALQETVQKDSEVIDLGSGTGFLAFLASKLGAKHITCIEVSDIQKTAKKLAKRNGITNCTFIQNHSTQVRSIPKADVLVSETLGNYALEENIIESIEDAKRFLKPTATIIPSDIRQYVCPVTASRLAEDIDVWETGYDLSLTEARDISMNNMYVKTVKKDDLLAEKNAIRQWDHVDFSKENDSVRTACELWTAISPVTIYGFALWWDAELTKNVHLSTSPLAPATHWEQIYLPLMTPIVLTKNESFELDLHSDTRWEVKVNLRWTVKVFDANKNQRSKQELDMRKGYVG